MGSAWSIVQRPATGLQAACLGGANRSIRRDFCARRRRADFACVARGSSRADSPQRRCTPAAGGLDYTYLKDMLAGKKTPSVTTLKQITDAAALRGRALLRDELTQLEWIAQRAREARDTKRREACERKRVSQTRPDRGGS